MIDDVIKRTIDTFAKDYVYVSKSKVEKAKANIEAIDWIKHASRSNTDLDKSLRACYYDLVEHYKIQKERFKYEPPEHPEIHEITSHVYKKWWEE